MKPRDAEIRSLVAQWLQKADLDYKTVIQLCAEAGFGDIVAFHAQQAVEKYLKALLTRHQVEFPKTHELERLVELVASVEPEVALAGADAIWLSRFGVEIRYPGDRPETLPGDEDRFLELAKTVRDAVMTVLDPYLVLVGEAADQS